MTRKRKDLHRKHRPESTRLTPHQRKLVRYYEDLLRSGVSEIEAQRAVMYAEKFGFAALEGPDKDACTHFEMPKCGAWECLNPDHQTVVFVHHPDGHH